MDSILRCGYIAIVGRPNVGKSTLSNAFVNMKLSAISKKTQTTRHSINAILTREKEQFIFVDTPGFQTKYNSLLNKIMQKTVFSVVSYVDVIIHVIEACKWVDDDEKFANSLSHQKTNKLLVINKIDKIKNKNELLPFIKGISSKYNYSSITPISANKKYQLDFLLGEISKLLPIRKFIFDKSFISDKSEKFLVSEIIREKIFRLSGDELPYKCAVVIEKWEEKNHIINIFACLIVEKESHRIILIGSKGKHIKRIAIESRQDIQCLLGKQVYLELYVKIHQGWLGNKKLLQEFGYGCL